ncbi:MAG: protease [Chloroflexi bacterium]|nr:protease [Chloroflexota bacterium]
MKKQIYQKAALGSLLNDAKVMDDIREMAATGNLAGVTSVASFEGALEGAPTGAEAAVESMAAAPPRPGEFDILEAIVLTTGRPPLLVKDDTYTEPESATWRDRLTPHRQKIDEAIRSVARVEILNHPSRSYLGTAWMISEDIMVTNRHVANLFARNFLGKVMIRTNPFGDLFQTQVDFKQEYEQKDDPFEVPIKEVIYIENDLPFRPGPDLAFVRVEKVDGLPKPIPLSPHPVVAEEFVAAIGYPARDIRNDSSTMDDIFEGIYQVKRFSPGQVSNVEDDAFVFNHDCTTLGGNSGSLVLRIPTGEAIGLHFAGAFLENNFAVQASTLVDRLERHDRGVLFPVPDLSGIAGAPVEAAPDASSLRRRKGYESDFLGFELELPGVLPSLEPELAPLKDSDKTELKYTHFSVVMHKTRRVALLTAVNIDGGQWRHIPRGNDRWYYDPRMDEAYQLGNELYKHNKLQRGHLVRRLDPSWGHQRSVAEKAIEDTFFWTNCTPQHEAFNPRSWLDLERYVLDNAIASDLKLSVFTGPIFRDTDKTYRGAQIPQDYWKVLVTLRSDTGQLSVTSYILSQSEFMDDLEFLYGEYKTYQVPLQKIIDLTQIDFGYLQPFDALGRIEALPYITVSNVADIVY